MLLADSLASKMPRAHFSTPCRANANHPSYVDPDYPDVSTFGMPASAVSQSPACAMAANEETQRKWAGTAKLAHLVIAGSDGGRDP